MRDEELKTILERHKHWLNRDCEGWENMRAKLCEADLSGADLSDANLRGANLLNVNLRGANLHNANLRYTTLFEANLIGACLEEVDLSEADLIGADLSGADLFEANLYNANLYKANLHNANFRHANLFGANFRGAMHIPYIPMVCPEEGSFIGWKKVSCRIVKLMIPEDAKRSSATTRECRCDKAVVEGIYYWDGSLAEETKVASVHDRSFIYEIGKEARVDDFCEDRWRECAEGIHFFMNRQEAINYIG